jgi:hypothetical protein
MLAAGVRKLKMEGVRILDLLQGLMLRVGQSHHFSAIAYSGAYAIPSQT